MHIQVRNVLLVQIVKGNFACKDANTNELWINHAVRPHLQKEICICKMSFIWTLNPTYIKHINDY